MFCGFLRFFEIIFVMLRHKAFFFNSKLNFGRSVSFAFKDLGSVFIKLGQFLALRGDIIGYDNASYFNNLYDNVTPFSYEEFISSLVLELTEPPEQIFSSISKIPVASASIAQVHKGVLKTGEVVAIKVLRPNIKNNFTKDIHVMYFVAHVLNLFVKKFRRLKLVEFVKEFEEICSFELDLLFEAANMSESKSNLSSDKVRIPEVFWKFTSSSVLVMEWMEAKPIYSCFKTKYAGDIAKILVNIFCEQVYKNKFFHADLHPGNIMVDEFGYLVLLDFGIVCRLDQQTATYVTEIFVGFLNGDYERVADVHFKAGYVKKNRSKFISACRIIGEPFIGKDMKSFSGAGLLSRLFKVTEDFGMETQTQLLLLQKSLMMVEGLCRNLDVDANIWLIAKEWMDSNFSNLQRYKMYAKNSEVFTLLQSVPVILKKIESLIDITIKNSCDK